MSSCLLGYNGERCDPFSGVTHLGNGYRAYSPELRRFNRPDSWSPFGQGGINNYAYCAGDPINHSDPSGHFSWQAGLGIALGVLGMLGAAFTAGTSLAAAGGLSAALATSSATTIAVGVAGVAADVSSVVSPLTAQSNPKASALLGWVAFAAGVLLFGTGLVAGGYQLLKESGSGVLAVEQAIVPELPAAIASPTLETLSQNPLIMSAIMRRLPGTAIDNLRATSKTLQTNAERLLTPLNRVLPERISKEYVALYDQSTQDYSIMESTFTNPDYIERVRSIWHGEYPLTSPSQLSKENINPLVKRLSMKHTTNIRMMLHPHSFPYVEHLADVISEESLFNQLAYERNQGFKQWQISFRELHAQDFAIS
ncbi:RHS repeat-associated core domain-containing protein [Winslowiella iniecta]|uniref:RHS repeat-associated core domain-containing protein n=1 Tax=Winslowiella iniecta TaxID=1560201 RepID=UPI00069E528F|nr:RHS repeat-associated core domain-containing protein [Winslowiella iniecta]